MAKRIQFLSNQEVTSQYSVETVLGNKKEPNKLSNQQGRSLNEKLQGLDFLWICNTFLLLPLLAGEGRVRLTSEVCYTLKMVRHNYSRGLIPFSRSNRKNQTEAEKLLWLHLRGKSQEYKFRRQYPVSNFILDFYCLEKKLGIELDGSQHLQNRSYDAFRSKELARQGVKIIRFWDSDVLKNISRVLEKIRLELSK